MSKCYLINWINEFCVQTHNVLSLNTLVNPLTIVSSRIDQMKLYPRKYKRFNVEYVEHTSKSVIVLKQN